MVERTDPDPVAALVADVRAKAEAATPGPYLLNGSAIGLPRGQRMLFRFGDGDRPRGMYVSIPDRTLAPQHADAAFIVAACNAAPALCAEIDRLAAELAAVTAERDAWEKRAKRSAGDWQLAFNYIAGKCRDAGVPEVLDADEDKSYTFEQIADLLVKELTAERDEAERRALVWAAEQVREEAGKAASFPQFAAVAPILRSLADRIAAGPGREGDGK